MNQIDEDADLIRALGGPTKLAGALTKEKKITPQRVQNWISRGIPPRIKVTYPHLFLSGVVTNSAPALANTAQPATENVAQGA